VDKETNVNILYKKPKWYNVLYEPNDEACGRVLLSYLLIEKDKRKLNELIPKENIRPRTQKG